MSHANFERFRQLVLQDVEMQQQLRATSDDEAFLNLLIELGQKSGCSFTVDTVEAASNAQRRLWLERWL